MGSDADNLPRKILVVDDDQADLNKVERLLSNYKITVLKAPCWETALYLFNQNAVDICIAELELPGIPGTVLVQKWSTHEMEIKRNAGFIIAASKNRSAADEALVRELKNVGFIGKPYALGSLLSALSAAMVKRKRQMAIKELKEKIIKPLIKKKNYQKALDIAKQKLLPQGKEGKLEAAYIYEAADELKEALNLVTELHESDKNNMLYVNEMGRLQMLLGDLDAAQAAFEKADQMAPRNIERINNLAELYLKRSMPEKSIEKYKELIDLSPEDKDVKYSYYEKLIQAGFEKHAQNFCQETSTPKELVRHYNNKGVMFSKQKNYPDAIDEYKKAQRLIPGNKDLYRIIYNRALAHINLKNMDQIKTAHELLEECLKLKPDFDKAKDKLNLTSKYVKKKKSA